MNGARHQPTSFAALVARLILEAEEHGTFMRLLSGELVPVDSTPAGVVQLFLEHPGYIAKEYAHAASQEPAAGS